MTTADIQAGIERVQKAIEFGINPNDPHARTAIREHLVHVCQMQPFAIKMEAEASVMLSDAKQKNFGKAKEMASIGKELRSTLFDAAMDSMCGSEKSLYDTARSMRYALGNAIEIYRSVLADLRADVPRD